MPGSKTEFYSNVQLLRKRIFKRETIWILWFLAFYAVMAAFTNPFSNNILTVIIIVTWCAGSSIFVGPLIRRLQKMPCPYCGFAARVGVLPFRHFRCMCCHRKIGIDMVTNGETE